MKAILKFFKQTYRNILLSIALYPVLISLLFVIIAVTSVKIDNSELVVQIKKNVPYFFIQDYDTVRAMLSTFIGGIISLTVFSFSMVMVVLGQASSNFSPRLLPGLISNKKHQIILGIYVGTLLYCTLILLSLGAYGTESGTLGLSAMLSAVMAVLCMGLFIYFVNSISSAIQIHTIVNGIYERCLAYAEDNYNDNDDDKIALRYMDMDNVDWKSIPTIETGYFRGFDRALMSDEVESEHIQIEIVPYLNQHMWKGDVIMRIKNDISPETHENLLFCLDISLDRHEDDAGIGGMIKLMEIAVKAMSPGINDPGTAIDAIIKLGSLLSKFLRFPHMISKTYNEGKLVLIKHNPSAEELMRILVQPIRLYAKKDSTVMFELIRALQFIKGAPDLSNDNRQTVGNELAAIQEDLDKNIENALDRSHILSLFSDSK